MPPIIILPGSVTSGPTRRQCVIALADQLGVYVPTTVTGQALADPRRIVLAEALQDDGEDEDDTVERMYLYVSSGEQAGAQRRIVRDGYVGRFGETILNRPLDAALLPGTSIEVTAPLPVNRLGRRKGLTTIVGEALDRILLEARIPLTGDDTRSVSLRPYPWVRSMDQTTGIYDSRSSSIATDPTARSLAGYRIATSGAEKTLALEATYATGEAYELGTIVRASDYVNSAGAWTFVDGTGLTADTDMTAVPLQWVVVFGMVKALEHLIILAGLDDSLSDAKRERMVDSYQRRMEKWSAAAAEIEWRFFPRAIQETEAAFGSGYSYEDDDAALYGPYSVGYQRRTGGWP